MGFNFEEYAKQNTLMLNNMNQMILDVEDKAVSQVGKVLKQLKGEVEILVSDNKLIKNKLEKVEIELEEKDAKIKKITDMTYVLKNDNDGKLESFKKRCHARVKLIVGKDKSSYKYILFYNCYIANIYSSITTSLYGERCNIGNISIDDYKMAVELAGRWQPSEYIINQQIKKYLSLQDKNKLSILQSKSLDEYLEEKHGGKIA